MKRILLTLTICLLTGALEYTTGSGRAATIRPKGRALLVGVTNYQHPEVRPTRGAEEDAIETAEFIKSQYGFLDREIKVLRGSQATAKNILADFQHWLIEETQPGDRVFFLYAGHGSRLPDDNKDEADGFDETLAPYDVKPNGENMIRDDELGLLIAQLSGRMAVLLFDSCHSGTITRGAGETNIKGASRSSARYLPTAAQLAAIGTTGSRGIGLVDYTVRDLPEDTRLLKTRDLKRVKTELGGPAAGIVVISAAQSGQVAFSMDVDGGRQRGALSYVFSELQRSQKLTLRDLQQKIPARIAQLQREERLSGKQQPVFEIISTIPLEDKPLFGDSLSVPAVALANPQSALKVAISSSDNKQSYQLEEKISYQVTINAPGWLYLLVFSEQNVATCVFPTDENSDDYDNYVRPGSHRLPRSKYFYAQAPIGKDVVIALLSSVKLSLGDKEEMTWDEVFNRLRIKKLAGFVQTRGVGTKKPGQASATPATLDDADWQAASLVIETIAKTTRHSPSAKQANAQSARRVSPNRNKPKQR